MLKLKSVIYLFLLLILIVPINAAKISGTVYDFSLKKANNAMVEINTIPQQFLVAQNGTYSFNVPDGDYIIKAQLVQRSTVMASVQENITIRQDGSYVLDLILLPDVEEGIEAINIDVNENLVESEKKYNITLILTALFLILAICFAAYYFYRIKRGKGKIVSDKPKNEEEKEEYHYDDLQQIIKIIKEEGGRATQKEIRKQIPLSEAKISLMIAELEHKGIIEKIKKGRGNIIILKKK